MTEDLGLVFIDTMECNRHCPLEVLTHGVNPVTILTLPPEKAKIHSNKFSHTAIVIDHHIPLHPVDGINNETTLTYYGPMRRI